MDTKTRMVKERLRNLVILTVYGSHWPACCNKAGITHLGACQVGQFLCLNQPYQDFEVHLNQTCP